MKSKHTPMAPAPKITLHEKPNDKDWRTRRAAYLRETGRLDLLKAEGLEHVVGFFKSN